MSGRGLLLVSALLLISSGPTEASADQAARERDAGPRASLSAPGRRLAVGTVQEIVLSVRMPTGHRVVGLEPPRLDAAEVVRSDSEVAEHAGGGWLHRTRFRVRALADGPLSWPALEFFVESPDGERTRMLVPDRVFDVAAVMRPIEDARSPFGLRELRRSGSAGGFVPGLATGVVLSLVGFGAWRASRRGRSREPAAPSEDTTPEASTPSAQHLLDEAMRLVDSDPREAANCAARTLRSVASEHFKRDLRATTTPELRRDRPAAAPRASWSEFVRIIDAHDQARFREESLVAEDVRSNLVASEAWLRRLLEAGGRR